MKHLLRGDEWHVGAVRSAGFLRVPCSSGACQAILSPDGVRPLVFTYEMQVGDRQGSLQVILATVHRLRPAARGRHSRQRAHPAASHAPPAAGAPSAASEFRTTLRLPPFKVMASDIVNLREGDLLESNLPTTTPCLLGMADGPLWEASPMLSDERIAAKLLRPHAEIASKNDRPPARPVMHRKSSVRPLVRIHASGHRI